MTLFRSSTDNIAVVRFVPSRPTGADKEGGKPVDMRMGKTTNVVNRDTITEVY